MSLRERAATESARTQSRQWKHRGKPRPTTTTLYPIFTPQGFQPNPTNPTLSLIPSQLIQGRPPRPGTATFPQQHQPNHRPLIQRTLDGKIATTVPAKKPKSRKPHRGPRPQTPTLSRKPRRQKQARPLRPSQLKHRSPPPPPPPPTAATATNHQGRYGDTFPPHKHSKVLRLAFQNINNLTKKLSDDPKDKSNQIIQAIIDLQLDIIAMAEIGLNWRNLNDRNQWHNRTHCSRLRSPKSNFAENRTCAFEEDCVPGGVGMTTTFEATHRVSSISRDPTGLGRWASMVLEGRQDYKLRVAVAYNPCKPATSGLLKVYDQHKFYFRGKGPPSNPDREPNQAFREDLLAAVQTWKANGEQIVIMMDANEDVRTGPLALALQTEGLWDAITAKHGSHQPPPATFFRNTNARPIDGIFTTLPANELQCGYFDFKEGIPGDHRMLWVDIPFTLALGHNPPNLSQVSAPRLAGKDPRVRKAYHNKVMKYYKKDGIFADNDRLTKLSQEGAPPEAIQKAYESLFRKNQQCREAAAKRCRKKKMGQVPWSPALRKIRQEMILWALVVRKKQDLRMSSTKIRLYMKKLGITDAFQITLCEAQRRMDGSRVKWKAAKPQAAGWRKDHLEGLAEALAREKNTKKSSMLKALRQNERSRQQARRVRRLNKKTKGPKVTRMFQTKPIPGTNETQRIVCEDPESMGAAGVEENEERFTRSLYTDFMQAPLLQDIGALADTASATAILEGTYAIPPDTGPFARLLIKALKRPLASPLLTMENLDLSEETLTKAWKKQDPGTASEPTGLNFTHLITGAYHPGIAAIDATLHNLPFKHGFAPDGWGIITDVAILKKEGVYDVEKMRTIQLMDSYFNMNNKRLGRMMMTHAERYNFITKEQYGSRKKHRAIDAGLNKVLLLDISRMRRWAMAYLPFDASQCYDRMNHNVTSLAMRATGFPDPPIHSMFRGLQQATHCVATAYGVSRQRYGGQYRAARGLLALMGIGQGNGCGPAAFVMLSTILIRIMAGLGYGADLFAAYTATNLFLVCLMFVDDNDSWHTAPTVDTPGEDIVDKAQEMATTWEGLLRATGGAINADKSCWYLLDYEWSGTQWNYRPSLTMPGALELRHATGEMRVLERKEPWEALKTLGFYQAPDGNTKQQIAYLLEKGTTWATNVASVSTKLKNDVWLSLTTTIMKTLEYPMRAIRLSKNDWDKIMVPILKVALPKSGVSKNFPHDVLYGPTCFQGRGLKHPWYHQELQHLEAFWDTVTYDNVTGQLFQQAVEEFRLELGTPDDITAAPFARRKSSLTDSYVMNLGASMAQFGISIEDPFHRPQTKRTHDVFLMQVFSSQTSDHKKLRLLNQCRTFLNVETLADITNAEGTRLLSDLYDGNPTRSPLHSHSWPRQPPSLSVAHWNQWKASLSQAFMITGSPTLTLARSLGDWTTDPNPFWDWHYSPATNLLYHREQHGFTEYRPSTARTQSSFRPFGFCVDLPPEISEWRLVTIIPTPRTNLVFIVSQSPAYCHSLVPPPIIHTLEGLLETLPRNERWAIDDLELQDNGEILAAAIAGHYAIAVSDGSHKDKFGTSAFVLEGKDHVGRILGENCVPGHTTEQSSYRSELAGIEGILTTVQLLCQLHHLTQGSIEIGLDNTTAIDNVTDEWDPPCKAPDFDLVYNIRQHLKALPITCTFRHVKGHQDDHVDMSRLDRWELLNVEMDTRAKRHLALHYQPTPPANIRFKYEKVTVRLHGRKLARFNMKYLYRQAFEPKIKAYWIAKGHFTAETWDLVDWDLQGRCFDSAPLGFQVWLSKHASGWCGVGRMLKIYGFQDHSECPRCSQPEETTKHVVCCPSPDATATWTTLLDTLRQWMRQQQTPHTLATAILQRLTEWRTGQPLRPLLLDSTLLREAFSQQDQIGWWNFLLGRHSPLFTPVLLHHYHILGSTRHASSWHKKLILKLWELGFEMWEDRNRVVHGDTLPPQQQQAFALLRQQALAEFTLGDQDLPPRERNLLADKDMVLALSLRSLQKWLVTVQQARAAYHRQHGPTLALREQQRRSMLNWRNRGSCSATAPTTTA